MKTNRFGWLDRAFWFCSSSALPAAAQFGTFYKNNITGTRGSWTMRYNGSNLAYFYIDVPANAAKLQLDTGLTGGYGDCDLYIGYGYVPYRNGRTYSYRSNRSSYRENITITNPRAGRWYVRLYAYSSYRASLRFICTRKSTTTYNWRTDMLNRVNNYRRQYSRVALVQQAQLQNAAQTYANSMATYRYYGGTRHRGYPDNPGWNSSAWVRSRVQNCGYLNGYGTWGARENIAAGQTTVASVMTDWWNSSGHRNNILEASMRDVGFGTTASSDSFGRRWVQIYGFRR
jgi:uncharacterized protein YkwD